MTINDPRLIEPNRKKAGHISFVSFLSRHITRYLQMSLRLLNSIWNPNPFTEHQRDRVGQHCPVAELLQQVEAEAAAVAAN